VSDYVEAEYISTTNLTADYISTIDAEINEYIFCVAFSELIPPAIN
jgi:hypothetical protein